MFGILKKSVEFYTFLGWYCYLRLSMILKITILIHAYYMITTVLGDFEKKICFHINYRN